MDNYGDNGGFINDSFIGKTLNNYPCVKAFFLVRFRYKTKEVFYGKKRSS